MKFGLFALAALAVPLAFASAAPPKAEPKANVPGVSAAGNAVLDKMAHQPPAGLAEIVKQGQAINNDMKAVISAPTINVDALAAVFKRRQALQARIAAASDARLIATLRALPPADRSPFLRAVLQASEQRAAAGH